MKANFIKGYYSDYQDRQCFERKQIPYACVQVGGQNFTFNKDFAEWLVENQPLDNVEYNQEYEQFCENFKLLSAKYPQYAGGLQLLFQKLAPSFVRVDFEEDDLD